MLENQVRKRHPKNIAELEILLIEERTKIGLSVLAKLVDSVLSGSDECIKMKGYPTRY